jgi:hypothetical protein
MSDSSNMGIDRGGNEYVQAAFRLASDFRFLTRNKKVQPFRRSKVGNLAHHNRVYFK